MDTVAQLVTKSRLELLTELHRHAMDEVVRSVHQLGLHFADEESVQLTSIDDTKQ